MGNDHSDRRGTSAHAARTDRRPRRPTGAHAGGALRLLCRADQHRGSQGHSPPRQDTLVSQPSATKPAPIPDVAADECHRREVSAAAACPASMAGTTLPRQTPSTGAGCLNWASPDLCGGRLATAVPTAIGTRCAPGGRRWRAERHIPSTQAGSDVIDSAHVDRRSGAT